MPEWLHWKLVVQMPSVPGNICVSFWLHTCPHVRPNTFKGLCKHTVGGKHPLYLMPSPVFENNGLGIILTTIPRSNGLPVDHTTIAVPPHGCSSNSRMMRLSNYQTTMHKYTFNDPLIYTGTGKKSKKPVLNRIKQHNKTVHVGEFLLWQLLQLIFSR